jgi:hypothetical protein
MDKEQLDKLEALARAAAEHSDVIGIEEWHTVDGELNLLMPRPDVELISACSPVAVLQLIDLARRAEPSVAADERALRLIKELSRISMHLAADLVKGADYTFNGHDYLDRNAVVDRIMQWRAEWDATEPVRAELFEQARAALASPAVSQQAAPEAPALTPDTVTLQFLTDVSTAAGLLSCGKRDKGLAERIGNRAYELRAALFAKIASTKVSPQGGACAHCNRLPGDPEGVCDWIECPVGSAPAVSQKDGAAVVCGMCNDSGIVGFPPDQYEECPDCIKARAATTASASDSEEAAKLQTLLMTEFECYRTVQGGLYAWALNALLDNSPHRMGATQALQIKTWLERMGPGYTDGGADLPEEVAMKAEIADLRAALARAPLPDSQEAVLKFAIEVEKMLCAALGREWATSGISIESLIKELATRAPLPAKGNAKPVAKVIQGTEWGPGLAFIADGQDSPKVGTLLYAAAPAQAGEALDTKRLDFMADEECYFDTMLAQGQHMYRLYWPHLAEAQSEWFKSPREAIDAAMSASQAHQNSWSDQ